MAKKTGGVKMGPKIPGVIKDPVKVKPIPMSVLKKIMGTDVPLAIKKKDGGLAEAIKKVKAKEMQGGGEARKGGDLIRVMKELEIMERPDKEKAKFAGRRKMLKKLIGKKEGGEAVPPKFKGFSKLPESVQQKMNPELAEKFGMGGDVKAKKSGNICRGRGIARPGTGFTIR